MNRYHMLTALLLGGLLVLASCSTRSTETGISNHDASWTRIDATGNTATTIEPDAEIMPKTHFAAGQLFEQQGAINKAIIQYHQALAGDDKHVPSLTRLGMLYARQGRHDRAEDALRRAVEIEPGSSVLRNNLGFEYVLQKRWAEAEREFREAIRITPNFDRAHVNLGLALAKQDQFTDALAEFRAVLPEPDAFYNLGLMLRAAHRYQDAAGAFQIALDFNREFQAASIQLQEIQPHLNLQNRLEPTFNEVAWNDVVDEPQTAVQPIRAATASDTAPTSPPANIEAVAVIEVVELPAATSVNPVESTEIAVAGDSPTRQPEAQPAPATESEVAPRTPPTAAYIARLSQREFAPVEQMRSPPAQVFPAETEESRARLTKPAPEPPKNAKPRNPAIDHAATSQAPVEPERIERLARRDMANRTGSAISGAPGATHQPDAPKMDSTVIEEDVSDRADDDTGAIVNEMPHPALATTEPVKVPRPLVIIADNELPTETLTMAPPVVQPAEVDCGTGHPSIDQIEVFTTESLHPDLMPITRDALASGHTFDAAANPMLLLALRYPQPAIAGDGQVVTADAGDPVEMQSVSADPIFAESFVGDGQVGEIEARAAVAEEAAAGGSDVLQDPALGDGEILGDPVARGDVFELFGQYRREDYKSEIILPLNGKSVEDDEVFRQYFGSIRYPDELDVDPN